jgi:imidazoleglycerol-phosphate dehydratase
MRVIENKIPVGIEGCGTSHAIIDEASSVVNLSFEGRSLCTIKDDEISMPAMVETTQSAHMIAFFEGFAQGAHATVHIRFLSGKDPHHIWESAFRAFGEALRASLNANPWRSNTTVGVKGI